MSQGFNPSRRAILKAGLYAAGSSLMPGVAGAAQKIVLPIENGERELVAYPEKRPLIVLTARPPQLETPFAVFNEGVITPNDAFFVRYHLASIPLSVDPQTYRIRIGGLVDRPLELSLQDLQTQFKPLEYLAVNQCSGNSRGFFNPRVNGGQLANGAMGNAKWTGVALRDVLSMAGIPAGARQVAFDGLDRPVLDSPSDFVKALDIDHAMDGEVMIAYRMNDADLPMLNGYPVRLVVPGYYGTYWVKHLTDIRVLDGVYEGYWMKSAYRIPDNACHCVDPGTTPAKTVPIGRFTVRSFITSPAPGATIRALRETVVRGIAFDSGQGIREVIFSEDGGKTWREAQLGKDMGRHSFREWSIAVIPKKKGMLDLRARAFNRTGESQPLTPLWQPAGYMRNVVESVKVNVV
ncbi:molybdopterin-dependent oxidoreductase [Noviherbaspirillum massiliense]|uniref:SorA family sulfite dehydrogenase catalytic subunit n=1 Tax=Noviherbaspirillum massiliense TaxID=1465823 RepID=UPI0002F26062|nr:molybdopterin-dependent oxidoreductase [Noviherbaspirillum massiliense]